jgi:putative endonuclease
MPLPALSRLPWLRRWFGDRSERAAIRFLRRRGFRIHTRNYRCPGGELDVIAIDGRCLVFVEVRSTAGTDPERPILSIDAEKQRRVTRAARHFLNRRRLFDVNSRFDIVIVCWPPAERRPRIEHFPGAFEAVGKFQMDF